MADSAPAQTRTRPASKPHGQWKVDGTEPLNHNEKFKQEDSGLNVRERIEQVYSKHGFESIADDDLHGRFRWWGLYTQRKPGIDGGKTATLEARELEDRYFMLRVRIDGGQLTTEQLRVIGHRPVGPLHLLEPRVQQRAQRQPWPRTRRRPQHLAQPNRRPALEPRRADPAQPPRRQLRPVA